MGVNVSPTPQKILYGEKRVVEETDTSSNVGYDGMVGATNLDQNGKGDGRQVGGDMGITSLENDILSSGVGHEVLDQSNGLDGPKIMNDKADGPIDSGQNKTTGSEFQTGSSEISCEDFMNNKMTISGDGLDGFENEDKNSKKRKLSPGGTYVKGKKQWKFMNISDCFNENNCKKSRRMSIIQRKNWLERKVWIMKWRVK